MPKHLRDWIVGALKYGSGLGLLAYVVSANWKGDPAGDKPGLEKLLERGLEYDALALAASLLALAVALQFARWYVLVRALDLPFTLRNAFRLGLVGYFYNAVLPGSVGGDLLKGFFIAKEQPSRRAAAFATVIADRAMGLFGLILFVAVAGSLAWALGNEQLQKIDALQKMVQSTAAIASVAVVGYLLLGLLPTHRADRFAGRLKHVPKVGHALAEVWYAVWMYRQRTSMVVLGVAVTAVSHVAMISSFYFASRGFKAEAAQDLATFPEIMVIAPIGFIVQAVPLSPGGVGVGEFAFAELYKLSGRSGPNGLAARLTLRLVEWGLGFAGYLVYLRMRKELPIAELATAEDAAAHGGHLVDPPMGAEAVAEAR